MAADNQQAYTSREQKILRFDQTLSSIENGIGIICFAAMGLFVIFSIISRLYLHIPIIWIEETSRHLMVVGVYVGVAIVTRERAHLNLSLLPDILPKKASKVVTFICELITLVTFLTLFLICASYAKQTMDFGQTSPALRYPMWWMYAFIAISFFLSALRQVMVMWDDYFTKKKILISNRDEITVN